MLNWLIKKIVEFCMGNNQIMEQLKTIVKDKTSQMTVDVIKNTFNSEYKFEEGWNLWGEYEISRIRNAIMRGVENKLQTIVEKAAVKQLKEYTDYIQSEKFIDDIVKRINTKQLGGS
jgi:hypothetical protein